MCAALLYKYTGEASHLEWAEKIFAWTRDTLKNKSLGTYYDDIDRAGVIGTAQFTYNSGCMLSAASLLYDITKKEEYLSEVRETAEGAVRCLRSRASARRRAANFIRITLGSGCTSSRGIWTRTGIAATSSENTLKVPLRGSITP